MNIFNINIFNIYWYMITLLEVATVERDPNFLVGNGRIFGFALALATGIVGIFFILQGIGLKTMAKNRNMSSHLAFVPIANFLLIARLAGKCTFFGRKMKNAGLYALIAHAVGTVLAIAITASQIYLFMNCGDNYVISENGGMFVGLSGREQTAYDIYYVGLYLFSIVEIVDVVLTFILSTALFRTYYARGYNRFAWLVIFIPLARYVIIFVLRGNKAVDYESYLRAMREEQARRFQSYRGYGNPYGGFGGPYGNPYNPYRTSYGKENRTDGEGAGKSDEPFSEFGSGKGENDDRKEDSSSSDPFDGFGSSPNGGDDLFGE